MKKCCIEKEIKLKAAVIARQVNKNTRKSDLLPLASWILIVFFSVLPQRCFPHRYMTQSLRCDFKLTSKSSKNFSSKKAAPKSNLIYMKLKLIYSWREAPPKQIFSMSLYRITKITEKVSLEAKKLVNFFKKKCQKEYLISFSNVSVVHNLKKCRMCHYWLAFS